MQALLEETHEEMKLSEENKKWLRSEIILQIEDFLHPTGWRRVTRWLRNWGLIGAAIGAFIALAAIAVTLGLFVVGHVDDNVKFQTTMQIFKSTTETRLSIEYYII